MRRASTLLAALAALLMLLAGCESREARSIAAGDGDGPALEVAFYGKVSRKSGRRSDRTDTFTMDDKARVYAFADFTGLAPDRDYTVHLVWIRPDGRELFRKYADLRLAAADSGYATVVRWLDGVDLHDVRSDTLQSAAPDVSLDSSLNVSADREREPGRYLFRVYLDRRLLREEAFTLVPAAG